MITSAFGKQLLDAYNNKYGTQYNAKDFFLQQFYPLFYNHPKYMMTAGNSPLENPKLSWMDMLNGKKPYEDATQRKQRLDNLMDKIDKSEADAAIAVGYPSIDVMATTSGQVSNLNIRTSKDDIYLSWIGAGLGVRVKGGFCILFNDSRLLLDIFEGWKVYCEVLNNSSQLRGNQINAWNGQWIAHIYANNNEYIPQSPMANFSPLSTDSSGVMSVELLSWTQVLIAISRVYETRQMIGYVYDFDKTNKTIGFIPFEIEKINKAVELYKKLFGIDNIHKAELLFGTEFGFLTACKEGSIGVKALKPKGLAKYMEERKFPKFKDNEDEEITINVYIIWLLAMLNNDELWVKAQGFATELQKYAQSESNAKTTRKRKVDELMTSKGKEAFLSSMLPIFSDSFDTQSIEQYVRLVNEMPYDNVPYFLTLLKIHNAILNNRKNQ